MKLNYYQLLVKQINKQYQFFRMFKGLPLTLEMTDFIKTYSNLENLAEIETFWNYLENLEVILKTDNQIYFNDFHQLFYQLFSEVKIQFSSLKLLYQNFQTWSVEYNEENLFKLTQLLLVTFKDHLDYILLTFKNLLMKNEKAPLVNYLLTLQSTINDQELNFETILEKISSYRLELNKLVTEELQKTWILATEVDFLMLLNELALKIKIWLTLYYYWLIINHVKDKNITKFSGIYSF